MCFYKNPIDLIEFVRFIFLLQVCLENFLMCIAIYKFTSAGYI